ncbi:lanthionine synthetase C family protein [Herbidospora sp. RD11066]
MSTAQSLASGVAGTALLAVERALTGSGPWADVHTSIRQVVAEPIDAAPHAALYYGAPAISFLLHAATSGDRRYLGAATSLDVHVSGLARRRLTVAHERMEHGEALSFREYDLIYGLTGIGALLLHRHPGGDVLADVLRHLVLLTRPCRLDGVELPGWWVAHDPDRLLPTPGGHANFGIAHGVAGPLALLSLATSRGCLVDGQAEAIEVLAAWFDRWRQDSPEGPWWPEWITREELLTGRLRNGQGRPSWCYGAVGIARALQLAGLATSDSARRAAAEEALVACLADRQLDLVTEPGLCHGMAGVFQTAYRAALDADDSAIRQRLPAVAQRIDAQWDDQDTGLLTGTAGVRLALETAMDYVPPRSGWDTCLLIA